ncbi:MAG: tRNA dihydrouridine(20/20a) synthase DusA [Alphaproteobacteria bacterium CG1_02_46_17]|nr:MAG: tRNA dihydrouridine(20/20a) synthase DusA [Alphaproteobacteria bacterium CG1_02_46_17]
MRKAIQNSSLISPLLSVAPMIDWTDRHCRYFHRQLSPNALVYTEMITTGAVLHGDLDKLLGFSECEHPIALQLGGSEPEDLAKSAKTGEDWGYNEINLNCGCPSERVQKGSFGACLMREPDLVADCIKAMQDAVSVPVTVKCRIGIDDSEDYPFLETFVEKVAATGCNRFIIHARKAWLKGLSPKENREIPPLRYDIAAQIKKTHPDLTIILNGGINSIDQIDTILNEFDGVMIGREAYQNPWFLAQMDHKLYGTPLPDPFEIVAKMGGYISERQKNADMPIHSTTRHMLGLFSGLRGAKKWRQTLGGEAHAASSAQSLFDTALQQLQMHQDAKEHAQCPL